MTKETENISVNLDEILRLTVDVTVSYLNNALPASEVPNFMLDTFIFNQTQL